MKKILIPTDFSEVASFAEKAALSLASRIGAEAVFLTCIKGEDHGKFFQMTEENVPMKVKEAFEAFKSRRQLTDSPYSVVYTHDKLTEATQQYAASHEVALLVMGSSGTYGWKQLWGSNAQKVSRLADCPVLIVKNEIGDAAFRNILFASDFRKESRKPFESLYEFAQLFGAHMHLAYVTTIETDGVETYLATKKMNAFKDVCQGLKVSTHMLGDVNAALGVEHFANEKNIDLVAMVSHQDGFFKKLLRGGSVSETLINRLEKPILVLPV